MSRVRQLTSSKWADRANENKARLSWRAFS
jgi:hypothetical protein